MKILVTGFEPFDGRSENASWLLAEAISEHAESELEHKLLSVNWGSPREELAATISRVDAVLALGEGRAGWIDIENTGCNQRHARKDNLGQMPPTEDCFENEADHINQPNNTLNWQKALDSHGLPVRRSFNAGGFLCDETLYTLLRWQQAGQLKAGAFVHLPPYESAFHWPDGHQLFDQDCIRALAPIMLESFLQWASRA